MSRRRDIPETFELLRFAAVAPGLDAVLLELEGRWPGGTPAPGRARLVVDTARGPRELAPVADLEDEGVWRATFAAPYEAITAPLAVAAPGLVVDLPAPDPGDDEAERMARLAREGNGLRRRLERAEEAAATAVAVAAERDRVAAERDGLQRELEAAREDVQRAHQVVEEREAELALVRQEAGDALEREVAERRRLEGEWAAQREAHEQQLAAAAAAAEEQRAQAEQREAELRDARAQADTAAQQQLAEARAATEEAHEELDRVREELDRVLAEPDAPTGTRAGGDAEGAIALAALEDDDDGEPAGSGAEALRRERDGLRAALDATRGELVAEREHLTALRADYARLREQLDEVRSFAREGDAPGAEGLPPDDAPTRQLPPQARGDDAGHEHHDDDTFETEPIVPRHRRHGGPGATTGRPVVSGEIARYVAVAVLALALIVVLVLIIGLG